ncbi:putative zinc ribbon protein [Serratia fonticola]
MCQSHYQGEKHCIACGYGIYSITETQWREHYPGVDDPPTNA